MPDRARVAVLISGSGTNMAALLYASRAADCPYEIVLVGSNNPEAGGLQLAADADAVEARECGLRAHHRLGQGTIRGKDQQPLAVGVEAADVHDARVAGGP